MIKSNTELMAQFAYQEGLTPSEAIYLPACFEKISEIGRITKRRAIEIALRNEDLKDEVLRVIKEVSNQEVDGR